MDWMYHPSDPDKSMPLKGMQQQPLLHLCMKNGAMLEPSLSLKEIATYCMSRLACVPDEHKRFQNPHIYKVGISEKLRNQRNELKQQHKT
jgi:nicotinate phosphoribosyltransferase